MVTHDPDAADFGDRILHIKDGIIDAGYPSSRHSKSEGKDHLLRPVESPHRASWQK
jgi:ABC-type lipoprotein export system ATPase subunit